jgi:molybdate transport system substrate-binding protein
MKPAKHSRICLSLLCAILLLGPVLARSSGPPPQQTVTVSAAASLKDALDQISQLYRSEKPGVSVRFNLGGSGTLQRQIEQGAPVDVFISASPDEMDGLEAKGLLLPGTRRNLVANSVVLIVPAGSAIGGFQDLAESRVKLIAIGEPQTVPAGKYAREVLTNMGLYDRLKPKFVLAKDVRQVLTYVATGNADAGIVYATDARISQKVKVAATAPPGSHSPVIYPVAVVKASGNPAAAKDFEAFLEGARAQGIFQKFGFLSTKR